jgi:hypothetical protein
VIPIILIQVKLDERKIEQKIYCAERKKFRGIFIFKLDKKAVDTLSQRK